MPPYTMWVTGPDAIVRLITAQCPSGPGDHRFVATAANGRPVFATYMRGPDGVHRAHSVHVLNLAPDRMGGVIAFLEPSLFGLFGMPEVWPVPHAA